MSSVLESYWSESVDSFSNSMPQTIAPTGIQMIYINARDEIFIVTIYSQERSTALCAPALFGLVYQGNVLMVRFFNMVMEVSHPDSNKMTKNKSLFLAGCIFRKAR